MNTQPVNFDAFHSWLRTACPATFQVILHELQVGHKTNAAGYAGLPANKDDLDYALRMLAIKGQLVQQGKEWHWKAVEKREPQKVLF